MRRRDQREIKENMDTVVSRAAERSVIITKNGTEWFTPEDAAIHAINVNSDIQLIADSIRTIMNKLDKASRDD